jgi:hypothetical protein
MVFRHCLINIFAHCFTKQYQNFNEQFERYSCIQSPSLNINKFIFLTLYRSNPLMATLAINKCKIRRL